MQAEDFTKALCAEKGPGEWFRLAVTDCRDVIQCTEAVSVPEWLVDCMTLEQAFLFLERTRKEWTEK